MLKELMSLFRKKEVVKEHSDRESGKEDKLKTAFDKVKEDMERLRKEAEELSTKIAGHNNLLKEHEKELKRQSEALESQNLKLTEHSDRLISIEEVIRHPEPVYSRSTGQQKRQVYEEQRLVASKLNNGQSVNEVDWDNFTQQEKRIVGVFLENKDMPLSYEDVGKVLNKSASTVKNQMKNIELKAKIFDETRDNEQRKRFLIKQKLRINRSLN